MTENAIKIGLACLALLLVVAGCSDSPQPRPDDAATAANQTTVSNVATGANVAVGDDAGGDDDGANDAAKVVGVDISGEPGAYTFIVTIESPDTGCDQYADWWEVVSEQDELIYRRILAHSHVDEQPFTRSGGPVNIDVVDNVYVRVHMNNSGYSPLLGLTSPGGVFETVEVGDDFAAELEQADPQPQGCAF